MTKIERETTARQINADEHNQPTDDRDDNPIQARTLNLNDLAQAHRLPTDDRVNLMRGILADLRSLEVVGGRDEAGIPHRGSLVFREQLAGRTIQELAAAYIELRLMGAQSGVIDALETVDGKLP